MRIALSAAAAVLATQLAAAAPVTAVSPAAFSPSVGTTVLQASQTKVTSSTGHRLRVALTASHQFGYDSPTDEVAVTLYKGGSGSVEDHRWTFVVPASAWDIDDSGSGAISVPASAISPYGKVKLTVAPVGEPTTQSCNGADRSQTQEVAVKGTFFFDTRSKGAHKWGTVGSKTKRFRFAANSTIVRTDDLPATPCVKPGPCGTALVWGAASPHVNLDGANVSSTKGALFASRTKTLSGPDNATRTDELRATTRHLAIKREGASASLAVVAVRRASGKAKLTTSHSSEFSVSCTKAGASYTQTYTTWDADYTNGASPLTAHAQVFGPIKLGNVTGSGSASFSTVTYA